MKTEHKDAICIIGARRGSRRLPGKNRMPLMGRPLYLNAVQTARISGLFSSIIFSTDDEEIIDGLRGHSGVIVDRRPARLADSQSSMWDVGRYLLDQYSDVARRAETLCFITPCHPFRTDVHLRDAYALFQEKKATTLISVTKFNCPPELSLDVTDQIVTRRWEGLVRKGEYREKYYPNGAISLFNRRHFAENGSIFSSHTVAYEMSWPDCLDIDYPEDYTLAQKLSAIMN